MQSYFTDADSFPIVAPATMTVDVPYVIGNGQIVIPCATAASGDTVEVKTRGVFMLTKVSAAIADSPHTGAEAITLGQKLYWDALNSVVTGKALGLFLGYAMAAAGSSATVVRVAVVGGAQVDSPSVFRGYFEAPLAVATTEATMFGPDIPAGYFPILYWVDVHTTFTDGADDSATIALGIVGDDDNCLKTATAVSAGGDYWDAGVRPPALAAAGIETTVARKLCVVVADDDLTAGAMSVYVLCAKSTGL